jgi:hypothetical protein
MHNYFNLSLGLMISLSSLLITDVMGSAGLNPDAEPYFPKKTHCHVAMVRTNINGSITYVSKGTLLKLEDANRAELQKYQTHVLTIYFRAAIYNSYHKVAYNLAKILFARILPRSEMPFSDLSKLSDTEAASVLSNFYWFLVEIAGNHFSSADVDCFRRHAAQLGSH